MKSIHHCNEFIYLKKDIIMYGAYMRLWLKDHIFVGVI
jgi:hypothetical protein